MGKIIINDKDVKINQLEPDTKKTLEGYENIALFGLDNRRYRTAVVPGNFICLHNVAIQPFCLFG